MCVILVIDDETIFLGFMKDILEDFGYDVKTAKSGEEGLKLFDDIQFDLVITDFLMPDINGFSVARHIRNSERFDTPIICVTGEYGLENMEIFNIVLLKPIKIKDMIWAIEKLETTMSLSEYSFSD